MAPKKIQSLKTFVITCFVFAILLSIGYIESLSQKIRHGRLDAPLAVLPASTIQKIDLGLDSFVASFLWLKIIQEVTTWLGPYQRVAEDISLVTLLEPRWSYPYAFGVILLPLFDEIESALSIGEKGIHNAKPDWRIPYYMALVYHTNKKERENATKYFDLAARTEGAPPNIQGVALSYGIGDSVRDDTRAIWQSVYETSNDEIVRERARSYVLHFDIIAELEARVEEYEKREGKKPMKTEDLVKAGLLRQIPIIGPFGFTYSIENGNVVYLNP